MIKKLLAALFLLGLWASPAFAQCNGVFNSGALCGNASGSAALPTAINPGTPLPGNETWSGDQYFGSGRPWCDVWAKGAVGDGVTDDSAAFAACITELNSIGGGIINVPPGNYCVFSGISVTGSFAIALTGAHRGTEIQTCGHDVTLLTMNNGDHELRQILLSGSQTINTTHDTVVLGSGCTECKIDHLYAVGGRYVLNIPAVDVRISDVHLESSYGAAVVTALGHSLVMLAK